MATAQLNARIDDQVKRAGDAVLERFNVPAAQAIRAMWQYMAEHQRLPHFISSGQMDADGVDDERMAFIDAGEGMALRMAKEAGIRVEFENMPYEQVRETAYEEMLIEQGKCRV